MKQLKLIPSILMLLLVMGSVFAYTQVVRYKELKSDVIKVTNYNPIGKVPIKIRTTGQDQARSSYSKAYIICREHGKIGYRNPCQIMKMKSSNGMIYYNPVIKMEV